MEEPDVEPDPVQPLMHGTINAAAVEDPVPPLPHHQLNREQSQDILRRMIATIEDDLDMQGVDLDAMEYLQLTDKTVKVALRQLNRGSAAGYSAWTFAFMRALFSDKPSQTTEEGIGLLTKLVNRMLSGRLRSEWWTPGRAVLLPKGPGA